MRDGLRVCSVQRKIFSDAFSIFDWLKSFGEYILYEYKFLKNELNDFL